MIWHSHPSDDIVRELQTDVQQGLSAAEAAFRLEEYGKNRLHTDRKVSFWRKFLLQLKDAMVIILLIAAAVSLALSFYNHYVHGSSMDWTDPVVIVAIVLLNAVLGVVQENKAEAALQALSDMTAPNARVRRGGASTVLPAEELVPGDIVELEAGDLSPADCRLIEAYALQCNESALTGESMPVDKNAGTLFEDITPLAERSNMVYAGCGITNGRAVAVVVATGVRSEMGHIASMLAEEQDGDTPLQKEMAKLGKVLGVLALAVCGIIFLLGLLLKQGLMNMFMTSVSLAVAAIPEGLPAIVTVVLALGVRRMVEQRAIIRHLPAVETLGSASVICSDKTGTLTQNCMTLRRLYAGGRFSAPDAPDKAALQLLQLAAICTDATLTGEKKIGDPTEIAILDELQRAGVRKEDLLTQTPRIGEIPFDSDRKRMTTVHDVDGRALVIVKGAPEMLLPRCTRGRVEEADEANRQMASDALRVLAVGFKIVESAPTAYDPEILENELTLAGLIGMMDPPRPEVQEAIRDCDTAGIRTVMITGDNPVTAAAIARELGILHEGEAAISGQELDALSDEELDENITRYRVYARVTPQNKIRIVKAWQRRGDTVAMTGDGVNDAPALKAADIGCAMGITGTEVSKGAADMVLTDDRFSTIVAAVREGRGIYDNIRKAVRYLLSCNLGEILTVFFSMVLWGHSPLLPVQLLWVNLITDSLPALALGMEPPEADILCRPPRRKGEGILAGRGGLEALWQGGLLAIVTLLAYYWGVCAGGDAALGRTVAFAVLALSQIVHAFNMRSSHPLLRRGAAHNRYMYGAAGVSLLLTLGVLLIPGVRELFSLVLMGWREWGAVAVLSLVPLAVMEVYKRIRQLTEK